MIVLVSVTPYLYSDFFPAQRDEQGYLIIADLKDAFRRADRFFNVFFRVSATDQKEQVWTPGGWCLPQWRMTLWGDVSPHLISFVGQSGIGAYRRKGYGKFKIADSA